MSDPDRKTNGDAQSRRQFLKMSSVAVAASALAGVAIPRCHAAGDGTIRLCAIGCGSRGRGAVANAVSVPGESVKLVAMADVFSDRLTTSFRELNKQFRNQVDVPPERQFLGFDAYRKAIDCLRPGDIAILSTRRASRNSSGVCSGKGRQCVHGKALRSRSGRDQADSARGRGGGKEESQDCRRADVSPFVRPSGHDRSHS